MRPDTSAHPHSVSAQNTVVITSIRGVSPGQCALFPVHSGHNSTLQAPKKWGPDSPWVFCNRKGKRVENVRRSFTTACTHVGIEDFRIHDLRHTCAAWLVSAGVPLTEVRDLLGHRTIRMTERYAHLAPEKVRAAVALLDGVESRSSHVVELDNFKRMAETK
jgi:hypothetical protein